MKKLLYLLICVIMLAAFFTVAASAEVISDRYYDDREGTYSSNSIRFTLDTETGVMTFTGGRALPDDVFYYRIGANREIDITEYRGYVKNVVIEPGIKAIGSSSFSDCTNLESITIPNSVTKIGSSAFSGCEDFTIKAHSNSFAATYAKENNISLEIIEPYIFLSGDCGENITYTLSSDGILILQGSGPMTDYDVWYEAWTYYITTPWYKYTASIFSVIISDGITYIGDHAFDNCYKLSDVYYSGTAAQWDAITVGLYNEYLSKANVVFTPKMTTTADAGYYAKSANAAEKLGTIIFNVHFTNYADAQIENFGVYIYNESMVQKANVTSTDKQLLIDNDGKVNVIISNIPYANFGSRVLAMPYAVVNGEMITGEICTFSVNESLKWLGENK